MTEISLEELENVTGGTVSQQDIGLYLYTARQYKSNGQYSLGAVLRVIHSFQQFSTYTPAEAAYVDKLITDSWYANSF